ncbi:hypothetical protein F0U62_21480 [Cystobacter fuscus]|nr:hypothetical protein F0U62_21480 [Cystobacter fuscus]
MGAPRGRTVKRGLVVGCLALVPVISGGAVARAASPTSLEGSRVLDRVVAVVGGQVLTLSELEFEARVALVERGGVRAADERLDERTLLGALELGINQRLLVAGADRLQAFAVDRSAVEERLRRFRERFEDEPALLSFLARHDADVDQLMVVLERSVRAERILDSRIRLRAQVSEAEVRRYWEEHKSTLGGSYEGVHDALKERLMRERYGELAKEEFKRVRADARVRRVAPFAQEARP